EIGRWLDECPQPYTLEHALDYIRAEGEETYAVTEAATGDVLGSIGLKWNDARDVAEVGYWTRASARGRGFTTRAVGVAARPAAPGAPWGGRCRSPAGRGARASWRPWPSATSSSSAPSQISSAASAAAARARSCTSKAPSRSRPTSATSRPGSRAACARSASS